jgi:hypothetical protein
MLREVAVSVCLAVPCAMDYVVGFNKLGILVQFVRSKTFYKQ